MVFRALFLAIFAFFAGVVAFAQSTTPRIMLKQPATVVEIFTSQGCPVCPAANAFAGTLLEDPDILVLSYSVDYWDYMGWKDTFSKPEFSERQRKYALKFKGQVYTPQMVVNGREHAKRYTHARLQEKTVPQQDFSFSWDQDESGVRMSVDSRRPIEDPAILVVRFEPGVQTVPVHGGQNRGKVLPLVNVVTECISVQSMDRAAILPPLGEGEAYAVLVHNEPGGPVIASSVFSVE